VLKNLTNILHSYLRETFFKTVALLKKTKKLLGPPHICGEPVYALHCDHLSWSLNDAVA
jgi:hypothetical protein